MEPAAVSVSESDLAAAASRLLIDRLAVCQSVFQATGRLILKCSDPPRSDGVIMHLGTPFMIKERATRSQFMGQCHTRSIVPDEDDGDYYWFVRPLNAVNF